MRDLSTDLPFSAQLLAAAAAVLFAALYPSLTRRRTRSWPWTGAVIEGGVVETVRRRRLGGTRLVHMLTARYSYSVRGTTHTGAYNESFASESEAWDLLRNLQELPPPVRYKPNKPSESLMDPYRDAALALKSRRDAPGTELS